MRHIIWILILLSTAIMIGTYDNISHDPSVEVGWYDKIHKVTIAREKKSYKEEVINGRVK